MIKQMNKIQNVTTLLDIYTSNGVQLYKNNSSQSKKKKKSNLKNVYSIVSIALTKIFIVKKCNLF